MNVRGLAAALSLLLVASFSSAQTVATTDVNPLPFHSYSGGKFDHIQMQNGSLYFTIPLYSLPQLGKLQLSFSITGHSAAAVPRSVSDTEDIAESPNPAILDTHYYFVDSDYVDVSPTEDGKVNSGFVRLQHDQALAVWQGFYINLVFGSTRLGYGYGIYDQVHQPWSLRDGTGATHQLGFDAADYSLLHTTDGSGWTVKRPISNTLYSVFHGSTDDSVIAYDESGNKYSLGVGESSVQDTNGNTITANVSPSAVVNANAFVSLTDTIGRTVPLPPVPSGTVPPAAVTAATPADITDCPNLGFSDQPLVSSYYWSPPGPSGGTQKFQLCYASLNIATAYWGGSPGQTLTAASPPAYDNYDGGNLLNPGAIDTWAEMKEQRTVLQSVLLPDDKRLSNTSYRSVWSFVYDSLATGASATYGNLVEMRTPEGGTIHYTYSLISGCGPAVGGRSPLINAVVKRVASAGSGPAITTTYSYAPTQTIETTNGNDIAHIFTLDQYNACGANETETKYYQGSAADNVLLKDVQTAYASESSPQDDFPGSDIAPNVNVRPTSVATRITGQAANITTYSYEPFFQDVEPIWDAGNANSYGLTRSTPVVISYLKPISTDDGIRTQLTPSYQASHPDYKAANFLDIRASSTTQDEQGHKLAEQTYQYDENNGSPQGLHGNLTSTTYWLGDNVTPLSDGMAYNAQGEAIKTWDRNGVATQVDTFQCGGLFPQSVTTAYGTPGAETTSSVRDCVTGLATSRTDANGVTSYFDRNDPLGRVTKFRSAPYGTPGESHALYTYPLRTKIRVASDKVIVDDGLLISSETYDGLGRLTQKVSPDGAMVDTLYDNAGNIQAVSNPYFSGTPAYTSFQYDALGRKTVQCNQDNGSGSSCTPHVSFKQWNFTGDHVITTDEKGSQWTHTYDALGRLSGVDEPIGSHTVYTYNQLNDLTAVDQTSGGNTVHREFHYDPLSRLVASYNPEAGWICYGTMPGNGPAGFNNCTPAYDGNGNLGAKTDARGAVTQYGYDQNNKLVSKITSGAGLPASASCFLYDSTQGSTPSSIAYGRGRLIAEWTQPSSCDFSSTAVPAQARTWKKIQAYDAAGEVLGEQQCSHGPCDQGGTSIHSSLSSYSYNLARSISFTDNALSASSPLYRGLKYNYDSGGHLDYIKEASATPSTLFKATAYDAFGLKTFLYGGSDPHSAIATTDITHDDRGRIIAINAAIPALQAHVVAGVVANTFPTVSAQVDCNSACGTVSFQIDNLATQTATLDTSGAATLQIGFALSVGSHNLTATYQGSSGATESVTVPFTVQASSIAANRLYAALAANPVASTGNAMPLVALGCTSACGTVSLATDRGVILQAVQVQSDGSVSFSPVPAVQLNGSSSLTVSYSGDATHAPASAAIPFTVAPAVTTMSTSVTPNPVGSGGTFAYVSLPADAFDNGVVTYLLDGDQFTWSRVTSSGSSAAPCCGTAVLGWHVVTIAYLGNVHELAAQRSVMFKLVDDSTLLQTSITASMSPNPVRQNSTSVLSTTIQNCTTNCLGRVYFYVDGAILIYGPPISWSGGVHAQAPPTNVLGTHTVTIQYTGDSTHAQSSTSYTYEVTQ